MTARELRQKYLDFFKKQGHFIIPSASLFPENDPSTLFVSSGMQPLVPFLMGEKHPEGTRLANSQKSLRAQDIEEVGDNRHNTFFEMLGNWSLGDYFKKEQLNWLFEFLTKELGLSPERLYISVYSGNPNIGVERDMTSVGIWKEIFKKAGVHAEDAEDAGKNGIRAGERIFYYGDKKNWWSRSGEPGNMPIGEIGGPDSEVFYDLGEGLKRHEHSRWKDEPCHINCDCGRFIEIGNSVFIEFLKTEKGFVPLPQKNVDFGGGFERLVMAVQGKDNIFETDLFINILNKIKELSGKEYRNNMKAFEVIADHLKGATFLMGDDKGIGPSNVDQGYIIRRLIRRALRYGRLIGIEKDSWIPDIIGIIIDDYKEDYPELGKNKDFIIKEAGKEEARFAKTLVKGEKMIIGSSIDGETAFNLFQTYGYPVEMTKEIAAERGISLTDGFDKEYGESMAKHQGLSRTAAAGKFKGGLADQSEATTGLHTAAHLLLASLRQVLGNHVHQKGSNITAERLRFDFVHGEKMTDKEKQEVEELVNGIIKADLPVECQEMTLAEAKKNESEGVFESRYGEKVKVYRIGNGDNIFSKEICGGPHVTHTGEIKGRLKISKEQSSSAGVRRIKAVLVDN